MSLSNSAELSLLNHIFANAAWADIGNAAGLPAGVAGSLYVALHSDVATLATIEAGDQSTNEVAYTAPYTRQAVARPAGWTVSSPGGIGTVTNAGPITFPMCTGGAAVTAKFFSVGTLATGSGQIIVSGQLNADLVISTNIQPIIPTGQLSITAD